MEINYNYSLRTDQLMLMATITIIPWLYWIRGPIINSFDCIFLQLQISYLQLMRTDMYSPGRRDCLRSLTVSAGSGKLLFHYRVSLHVTVVGTLHKVNSKPQLVTNRKSPKVFTNWQNQDSGSRWLSYLAASLCWSFSLLLLPLSFRLKLRRKLQKVKIVF